jgi:uncharacterized membrane protein
MTRFRSQPKPDLDERLRRSRLDRYLLADEIPILAQRQHWASFWRPIAFGVAGLIVLVLLGLWLPASLDALNPFVMLAWLVIFAGWASWRYFMWRREWLVATDKRVLVNYGLINQGVAMISLARIVDLTYTRSTFGHLLGYGTLERESQKHPHSLHEVKWVRDPDSTYLTICAAIFNLQDRMFGMVEDEHYHRIEDRIPPHAPGLVATPAGSTGPIEGRDEPDQGDDPPGIRIHYGVSRHNHRDPWHLSADLRDSSLGDPSLRDGDTGEIPLRRSATDEIDDWLPKAQHKDPDQDHHDDLDPDQDHHG